MGRCVGGGREGGAARWVVGARGEVAALEAHRNIKEALVEAARLLVKANDNEDAKTLLLYFL